MYSSYLRPFLFKFDPEKVHDLTIRFMRLVGIFSPIRTLITRIYAVEGASPVEICGIKFPNRVGLAAGFDKDGLGWRGLSTLGFGHIEIGTVTPSPQIGNPKPRVFRLSESEGIINRMGFPGKGADFVRSRMQGIKPSGLILGVNIGKNEDTPLETAYTDYVSLVKAFAPVADYLAINISSPNTVGLRQLQKREYLDHLLDKIISERDNQTKTLNKLLPIFVKVAPDLTDEDLISTLDVILPSGIDGIIATNTTTSRNGLASPWNEMDGGLSGALLTKKSTAMISKIAQHTEGKLPIIAAGGVMTPDDAIEKINAGADLIQLYTGLIFKGPSLAAACNKFIS